MKYQNEKELIETLKLQIKHLQILEQEKYNNVPNEIKDGQLVYINRKYIEGKLDILKEISIILINAKIEKWERKLKMKSLLKYQKNQYIIQENRFVHYCYSVEQTIKRLKSLTGNDYSGQFLENLKNGQRVNL